MAGFSGSAGAVKVGTALVADVTKWSAEQKTEVSKYGSSSTSGWKAAVAGTKEITGEFEAVLQDTGSAPFDVGSTVSLTLQTDQGTTPKGTLSGSAIISSIKYEVNPDTGEVIKFTASFEGNGAWTKSGVFASA